MALCNPAVAQGSIILLRHCQGVLSGRKKMSREREVNKESKRKDSKRKRCQVNGMSRERDVQRKSQEREMSRDLKRNRVQEEEIHNKVISEESSAARTRHFHVPCPTKFNVASKLRLKLCGSQKMPTMGRMMMIAPFGLRWFSSRLGIDQRAHNAGETSPSVVGSLAPDLHRKENSVVAQGVEKA